MGCQVKFHDDVARAFHVPALTTGPLETLCEPVEARLKRAKNWIFVSGEI